MKYNIRKTSINTARITIESNALLCPTKKPEIWRFYLTENNVSRMSTGLVLGRTQGKSCAYVIHVRRRDLICIRKKLMDIEDHRWTYYRINERFEPVELDIVNRCLSKAECVELLQIEGGAELEQVDYTDQELRGFLAQKHPAWLQEIVDRQINHWQLHKPDKFFRLAPKGLASSDITRCVKESPHAALERFQLYLNKTQLALCLLACPKSAVMFATEKIPPLKRNDYLLEHPKEAIEFAAEKLSDDELQLVSSMDIFTAYRCRESAPPHRRAIMLACSYMIGLVSNVGLPFSALHEEIRKSMLEHPRAWLSSTSDGFPAIFKDLERFALMQCDHSLICDLLERLDPDDSKSLSEYIATSL